MGILRQHITPQDLDQLTDLGKQKLREWWKPTPGDFFSGSWPYEHKKLVGEDSDGYGSELMQVIENKDNYLPLLSIGQMIQFLDEHGNFGMSKCETQDPAVGVWELDSNDEWIVEAQNKELCDALWSACVEVLHKP